MNGVFNLLNDDLQALNTVLKTTLTTLIGARTIGDTTSSVMTGAQRIFRAATTGGRSKIFLGIVAFTTGMNSRFFAVNGASFDRFAGDQIQLFKHANRRLRAGATTLQTTVGDT